MNDAGTYWDESEDVPGDNSETTESNRLAQSRARDSEMSPRGQKRNRNTNEKTRQLTTPRKYQSCLENHTLYSSAANPIVITI